MRTDDEMVRSAQASLLIGGLVDALALRLGGITPTVDRVAVAFEGTWADGQEFVGGVLSTTVGGGDVSAADTVLMFAEAAGLLAEQIRGSADEE